MNRVLEKVFPAFTRHAKTRSYYSYPEVRRTTAKRGVLAYMWLIGYAVLH